MTGPSSPPAADTETGLGAARDRVVACDLAPLAVLAVAGPDAQAFLHGQLSSDVAGLGADQCQFTSYNSPAGRMLANFVLWRPDPDPASGFHALLPPDVAAAVEKRLRMFVLRSKVTLRDVSADVARWGLGGPDAPAAVAGVLGAAPPPFGVARVDGTTVLGLPGPRYVALAPAAAASPAIARLRAAAEAAPFSAWQWLTVHAGVPVVTVATQDKFVAQAANWDILGGVNFRKGCYPGQEIVARMQYLGRLKERLYAFHAAGGPIAAGTRLHSPVFDGQPCGTVVNAAPAPDGGSELLAVVQIAAAESADVRLGAPDGPRLAPLPLPYAVPALTPPRARAPA